MRIGDIIKDIDIDDAVEYCGRVGATAAVFYTLEGCIAGKYELNWFGHLMVFGTSCMIGNVIASKNRSVTEERYGKIFG